MIYKGRDEMAEKDIVTKEYMSDNRIFADVFNFFVRWRTGHRFGTAP